MKSIATIHWLEGGREKQRQLYDQQSLNVMASALTDAGVVHWTCLTGGAPPTYFKAPERPVETLLREKHHRHRFANKTPSRGAQKA